MKQQVVNFTLSNNSLLTRVFGENDKHLHKIEKLFSVDISSRGNSVFISGDEEATSAAKMLIENIYEQLAKNIHLDQNDIDSVINVCAGRILEEEFMVYDDYNKYIIKTPKKNIVPYSKNQLSYIKILNQRDITFAVGPAGTGKTYIAVACAVEAFCKKEIDRIVLTRPVVEAGEKLGFLPGGLKEKIDPYLRPLYDALHDMIPAENLNKLFESGEIEIAPLAYMRGRTLNNSFIILDEAQNTTDVQMKMFLTRLGASSKFVITGDPSQTDLPKNVKSGLADATEKLKAIEEIGIVNFSNKDIIRHPLTAKILQAYA